MDNKASSKNCSPETDPKFWEWLRNRDKPASGGQDSLRDAEKTKRLQLELPMAPVHNRKKDPDSERGVCIIEVT